MTYCVAISVDRGLVFASDSRTNAGVDQVSIYSKMHTLVDNGERLITLLSAGNLATTQAVTRQLRRDMELGTARNLQTVHHLAEAAEYVGELLVAERLKRQGNTSPGFNPEASFILGGQIRGREHQVFLVYSEGNHIGATIDTPYLQTGEVKYGKPILDRIIHRDLSLEDVARCALVSMDSTMRSNVSVGPPIEVMLYETGTFRSGARLMLTEDDDYLRDLRRAWHQGLTQAFERLPRLPVTQTPRVRLVDG